jgi:hypothetical protein
MVVSILVLIPFDLFYTCQHSLPLADLFGTFDAYNKQQVLIAL